MKIEHLRNKYKLIDRVYFELIKRRNFILYSMIGVSGATLDFLVFLFLFNLLDLDKNVATFISTSLGIVNNFFLNALLNFKVKDHLVERFVKFYAIGFLGFLMTVGIFYIFVDIMKINANLVKGLSIFFVVIVQYTLNKKISLKA